jgi:hypothetical protein
MARAEPTPTTVDRLRHEIDRGVTGDKIPASDPAAAPLGSDAEAGGAPPTREEIDLEARRRTTVSAEPPRRRAPWVWAAGLLIVLVLVLALLGAG